MTRPSTSATTDKVRAPADRSASINTGTKTTYPVSLAEATKVFDKLVASKLAKG